MNCFNYIVIENKIPFVQRLWSIKRAQLFVDIFLEQAGAVIVEYAVLPDGQTGEIGGGKISIARSFSTAIKWRTLLHEMAHTSGEGHHMKFLEDLRSITAYWRMYNEQRLYER